VHSPLERRRSGCRGAFHRHYPRASKIRTPALLQAGGLDINHNSELYWSLTHRNIPIEYVTYPGSLMYQCGATRQRERENQNERRQCSQNRNLAPNWICRGSCALKILPTWEATEMFAAGLLKLA